MATEATVPLQVKHFKTHNYLIKHKQETENSSSSELNDKDIAKS